ncbi:TonB-dependent receptor [Mucilaginibacter calamicampi]|uniref:TonB-dependent receptor n=1 Tax=Mucilaginibacter calamicampi TaxID=1302352 RepID=A0ABW2Z0N4_9SPHI
MKNLFTALFALLLPVLASAQFSISGKVNDSYGNALQGATIRIENSTIGTTSDTDGNFNLNNLRPGKYSLKVSFIGFETEQKNVSLSANIRLNIALTEMLFTEEQVVITGVNASYKTPVTFTNLHKADIAKNNSGRGFEYLLEQTPSAVVSSNAGAGVGYTGIRIRGSDGTRINLTVNGIPINDAESQGSFSVNLPDLASSINSIQVQRGVGTSTNGAGAFGASINIQTNTRQDTAYTELNNSAGSYGTVKNTVNMGTGLLGGHFSFDGRLSRTVSDGYIERASSNLRSFFLSGAYYGKNDQLRLNVFSGHEKTYQAWNGVLEETVTAGNPRYNEVGYIAKTGGFYDNQTDNYTQNHYQLLYDRKLSDKLTFNGALHYTRGYGYYEEYKNDAKFSNYGLTPVVIGGVAITNSDLVRQLWLSNHFYGTTYNFTYKPNQRVKFILGGAYNEYKGDHYDKIMWTQQSTNIPPGYEYARDFAKKTDFNVFGRSEVTLGGFLLYGDLQYRHINYSFLGFDRNLNNVQQQALLDFFNPKVGATYSFGNSNVYASFAVGNHEPNRNDFTNSTPASRPKSENLKDFEAGYRFDSRNFSATVNGFYMLYKNQLVLTGSLNDVGAAIRTNIDDSYRAGVEVSTRVRIAGQLTWLANATVSANKVKNFNQYLYNYDTDTYDLTRYTKSDIAYSPAFIAGSTISYKPIKNTEIAFISKYVSRQYLDNTSTKSRSLAAYFVNDVRLAYNFKFAGVKNIGLGLLINNVFSEKYQSDGATYPDIESGVVKNYNYWFPQAPINFLGTLNVRF